MAEYSTHKELMGACRSTNGDWDPTAPEWYMRLMDSKDPIERVMGWMQYRTVRFQIRKPYASDELGRVLTLKDLAAFYGWTSRYTQKLWSRVEARGYVQRTEGKLWIRADFKVNYPIVREDGCADATPPDPVKDWLASLPDYQREAAAKVSPAEQRRIVANLALVKRWEDETHRGLMMAVRGKSEPEKLRILQAYNIPVKPQEKTQKRKEGETPAVRAQLDLFDFPVLDLPQAPTSKRHNPPHVVGASVGAESAIRAPRTGAESAPRQSATLFLAAESDTRIPDAEFKQAVIAAFVDAGKPHPSAGQLRDVIEGLPDHALAAPAFLADLRESMQRIKHPGVLSSHVRGFAAAWPARLEKIEFARVEEQRAETKHRMQQRGISTELEIATRGETIWDTLTAADKDGRIAGILPGLQKQYGQRLPADMLRKNAETIARGQFIQEYIARVSQGEVGISEVA